MTDYEARCRAITDETRAAIGAALGVDVANVSRPRMSYGHRSVTLNETAIRALLALTATTTPTSEEN